jgi:hypothetical protein
MHGGGTGGKGGNSFSMGDINVTTQGGTGDKQQDDAQAGRVAESVKEAIHQLIDERMFGSHQYGGAFNPRGM